MQENSGYGFGTICLMFLAGATAGAAAGAAVALLTAPQSGVETRKRLRGIAVDSKDIAERIPEAFRDVAAAAGGAARNAFVGDHPKSDLSKRDHNS